MDLQGITFIVGVLTFSVALNLWLTFRLFRLVRLSASTGELPKPLPVGSHIEPIQGQDFIEGAAIDLNEPVNLAKVYLFLSSECDKCKSKLSEILNVLDATEGQGVNLWLISMESKRRVSNFLSSPTLMGSTIKVTEDEYDRVNPTGASPYYMFVDHNNLLQAEGFIGDENWISFTQQLDEAA